MKSIVILYLFCLLKGHYCTPYGHNKGNETIKFTKEEIPEFFLLKNITYLSEINAIFYKIQESGDVKNIAATEFDVETNCLFWATKKNNTAIIKKQCFDASNATGSPETLHEIKYGDIKGLAYDWVSKVLYFTSSHKLQSVNVDTNKKAKLINTNSGYDLSIHPQEVAVHPAAGYIYWTDWFGSSPDNTCIYRRNLDGSNETSIYVRKYDGYRPKGLTIDYHTNRVYWLDETTNIKSVDLDGKDFIELPGKFEQVSSLTVFKNVFYWTELHNNHIFAAIKSHISGSLLEVLSGDLAYVGITKSSAINVKIVVNNSRIGTNKCADSPCSHICLGAPDNKFVCVCPDDFELENGICVCQTTNSTLSSNKFYCPPQICNSDQFLCEEDENCIDKKWVCDGEQDCSEGSDEMSCPNITCASDKFKCELDNKCISKEWVCNGKKDCSDGADEKSCPI